MRQPMEDSRRCKAHKSDGSGERCMKPAMLGQSVCRAHGGASPQAKKSARERLEALVDPAINTLRTVIRTGTKTGDTPSAVRASLGILDRTGFHPSQAVELKDGIENQSLMEQIDKLSPEVKRLILADIDGKLGEEQRAGMKKMLEGVTMEEGESG
jgi:hypothetical protein